MENNWKKETDLRIDKLIDKLNDSGKKRLQLEYLKIVVNRVEKEAANCEKCSYFKNDITDALNIIEEANVITSIQIRAYNTRIKQIIIHFRKVHGLISSTYYASQYSMYGFIGGIAMSVWFFDQFIIMLLILLMGPFIGKLIGGFKDYRNQGSDKLI